MFSVTDLTKVNKNLIYHVNYGEVSDIFPAENTSEKFYWVVFSNGYKSLYTKQGTSVGSSARLFKYNKNCIAFCDKCNYQFSPCLEKEQLTLCDCGSSIVTTIRGYLGSMDVLTSGWIVIKPNYSNEEFAKALDVVGNYLSLNKDCIKNWEGLFSSYEKSFKNRKPLFYFRKFLKSLMER